MNQDGSRPAMGADQRAHRDEEEARAPAVVCPFCRCRETELVSLFGGQLSTDQYYCRACHTYFERFSRDELADDAREDAVREDAVREDAVREDAAREDAAREDAGGERG